MQDSEAGEIPEDLMIEIAARLPAKSTISEHWVFVLEAGGSWKRVAKDFQTPHHPSSLQVTMKNVLYYLAFTDSSQTCVLVSFTSGLKS
uniref:F-box associated beta-propeller type 3 domain-containing protein n=1 Tax=Brassica oleracea TaxID=3712 RepID=A0A3P6DMB9_BRAOL|nr:unnamed protein product [Brassica oleracea]